MLADVQYCTGGGKPLLLDIFILRNRIRRPTPTVLWLHGRGWERGDKNGSSGVRFLASASFVTASIGYRLSGEAKFPADIQDCPRVIRFLRANAANYELDADRIAVGGASSGGDLALLAGLTDQSAGLKGSGGWANVSTRGSATVSYLMVHGDDDTLVHKQSKRMLDACLQAGVRAKLIRVDNVDHDFKPRDPDKPLSITIGQIHSITVEEFFKKRVIAEQGHGVRPF
jgi:acetyl esterase/lipase